MDRVIKETAIIYRANGRRYFSKRSACIAMAREKIKSRCECDKDDWSNDILTPGYACHYHRNADRFAKMIRRLARIYSKSSGANVPEGVRKDAELPPLPKSHATEWHEFKYTEHQMREYARAAIAASKGGKG